MSGKYDGWTVKDLKNSYLSLSFLSRYRSNCISKFEQFWGKRAWQKHRKEERLKLVKVKLVEVK